MTKTSIMAKNSEAASSIFASMPKPIPERIVIYMDSSPDIAHSELRLNDKEPLDSFDRLKKIIRMFMMNKEFTCCNGPDFCQFTIMTELGGSASLLGGGEFLNAKGASSLLEQLGMKQKEGVSTPTTTLDLGETITYVNQNLFIFTPDNVALAGKDGHPPLGLTRLIMFVTRSRSPVKLEVPEALKKTLDNPYFCVDVVYLHELAGDDNLVEVNWHILQQVNELQQGRGYMLECGPDVTDWHNASALLLPSPILRVPFKESEVKCRKREKLGPKATAPENMELDDDCMIVDEKMTR